MVVNFEQTLNTVSNVVTLDVSQFDTSNDVNFSHQLNNEPIDVTFDVFQLLTSNDVTDLQFENVP